MKVKCKECGFEQDTGYKHSVCKKCFSSIHTGKPMPSLMNAIQKNDKKLVDKIMEKAEKGEIIRLM